MCALRNIMLTSAHSLHRFIGEWKLLFILTGHDFNEKYTFIAQICSILLLWICLLTGIIWLFNILSCAFICERVLKFNCVSLLDGCHIRNVIVKCWCISGIVIIQIKVNWAVVTFMCHLLTIVESNQLS